MEEIHEDCTDIIRGKYPELIPMLRSGQEGERGIMGERGEKGMKGMPFDPLNPLDPLTFLQIEKLPFYPLTLEQIEKLPFYPLNPLLPLVVQLKLRCKELSMLLYKLQQSLDNKMDQNHEKPAREKLKDEQQRKKDEDQWLAGYLKRE